MPGTSGWELQPKRTPRVNDAAVERAEEVMTAFFAQLVDDERRDPIAADDPHGEAQQQKFEELQQYYLPQLEQLRDNREWDTIIVDWQHLENYAEQMCKVIQYNYPRFEPGLRAAVKKVMKEYFPTESDDGDAQNYYIAFTNVPQTHTVRGLRCANIGHLVHLRGTITRTTQVRPELIAGQFTCLDCMTDSPLIEQQYRFTEPQGCTNEACSNGKGGRNEWKLKQDGPKSCVFVDWQKLKVQECADEIPSGSMPRTLDVIVRGDCVEIAKPGDKRMFSGYLVVVPEVAKMMQGTERKEIQRQVDRKEGEGRESDTSGVSMKSLGNRDMQYKLAFMAIAVLTDKGSDRDLRRQSEGDEEAAEQFTPAEMAKIHMVRNRTSGGRMVSPLESLSKCIAPNVCGHDMIKKGLLLQAIGGVAKHTADGIKLRGDINVCIIGDPSTAKSQFLKFIGKHIPRAIYTSGKSSSASGLTATVVKDSETREFTIEAGALMLADKGVCCIDEFEKMDMQDQVAIHEAMEQQTISLAKAGMKATLNARASVLAAANPIEGRYNKTLPLKANVAMTAPIMSRFDLFFIVTDDLDDEKDSELANMICRMHSAGGQSAFQPEVSIDDFLLYLRWCTTLRPRMTPKAGEMLVEQYSRLRENDLMNKHSAFRITTRQLESMIRLSEAVARIHGQTQVRVKDVKYAIHLVEASLSQVDSSRLELELAEDEFDPELNKGFFTDSDDDGGPPPPPPGGDGGGAPPAPKRRRKKDAAPGDGDAGDGDAAIGGAGGGDVEAKVVVDEAEVERRVEDWKVTTMTAAHLDTIPAVRVDEERARIRAEMRAAVAADPGKTHAEKPKKKKKKKKVTVGADDFKQVKLNVQLYFHTEGNKTGLKGGFKVEQQVLIDKLMLMLEDDSQHENVRDERVLDSIIHYFVETDGLLADVTPARMDEAGRAVEVPRGQRVLQMNPHFSASMETDRI